MVFYRVEPIFDGNNMLASGVLIEAKSKKAGGLSFCVYCYNVQPGISINYTNGASSIDEVYVAAHPEVLVQNSVSTASSNNNSSSENSSSASLSNYVRNGDISGSIPDGTTYVLNTNTKKFHYPTCSSVSDMAPHNTEFFSGSRDEAISRGFSPCGRCHP